MTNKEFANKLSFAFISEGIEAPEIEAMLYRGFLKNEDIFYKAYLANRDAFMEKYQLYKETESMLTAGEVFDQLRNNVENITEVIPDSQTVNAMAEYGVLSEGLYKEISISADALASTESSSIKEQSIAAELTKESRIFLFDKQILNMSYEDLKGLADRLPEQELDEEMEIGEKEDKKPEKAESSEKTPVSEEESTEELPEEPVFIEEDEPKKRKKQTSSSSGSASSSPTDSYSGSTYGETYSQSSVVLPLSDGSYIVVGTAVGSAVPAYTPPAYTQASQPEVLSNKGLYEVLDYVKQHSGDDNAQLQIIKYDSSGEKQEILWGTNESSEPVGNLNNFITSYAQGQELPEYSDSDKSIQAKLGAYDYSDGSHDTEFSVETSKDTGEVVVHWKAEEYMKDADPSVIESGLARAEEIRQQSPEYAEYIAHQAENSPESSTYSPSFSENSSSDNGHAEPNNNPEGKTPYDNPAYQPAQQQEQGYQEIPFGYQTSEPVQAGEHTETPFINSNEPSVPSGGAEIPVNKDIYESTDYQVPGYQTPDAAVPTENPVNKYNGVVIDFQPSEKPGSELNDTAFSIPASDFVAKIEQYEAERTEGEYKPRTFASLGYATENFEAAQPVDSNPAAPESWTGKVVSVPLADGGFITVAPEGATEQQIHASQEYARRVYGSDAYEKDDPYASPIATGSLSEAALIGAVEAVKSNAGEDAGIQIIRGDSSGKPTEVLYQESESGTIAYGELFDAYYGDKEHIVSSEYDKADLYALGAVNKEEIKNNITVDISGETPVVNIAVPEGMPVTGAYYDIAVKEAQDMYMESLPEEKRLTPVEPEILFNITDIDEDGEREVFEVKAEDVSKDLIPVFSDMVSGSPVTGAEAPVAGTEFSGTFSSLNSIDENLPDADVGMGGSSADAGWDPYSDPSYWTAAAALNNDTVSPYDSILEPNAPRVLVNVIEGSEIEMTVDGTFDELTGESELRTDKVPEIVPLTGLNIVVKQIDVNGDEIETEVRIDPDNLITVKTLGDITGGEIEFSDFRADLIEDAEEITDVEKQAGMAAAIINASMGAGMVVATDDGGFEMKFDQEWLDENAPDLEEIQKNFNLQRTTANAKSYAYEILKTIHKAHEMGYTGEETGEEKINLFDFDNLEEVAPGMETKVKELTEEERENLVLKRIEIANQQTKEQFKTRMEGSARFVLINQISRAMQGDAFGEGINTIRNGVRVAGMIVSLGAEKSLDDYANKVFAADLYDKYQDATGVDAYQKIDMHSAKSRRAAIKNAEAKVKASTVLNRAGVHKMARADLKKILDSGKIANVALSNEDLNTVRELLVLKGVNAGDLDAINAIGMLNATYHLNISSQYNLGDLNDIHKIIGEIDTISMSEQFSEVLGGTPLSLLSDKKLEELLADENVSQELKDLIGAHQALKAYEKQKEYAKQQGRSLKSTAKFMFMRAFQGTDLGDGFAYLRKRYRIARMILHVLYIGQKMIDKHALARQIKRMNDPNAKFNSTRIGKWYNERLQDRIQNGTKWEQFKKKTDAKKADADNKIKGKISDVKNKIGSKANSARADLLKKKNAAKLRASKTKLGRQMAGARTRASVAASRLGKTRVGKVANKITEKARAKAAELAAKWAAAKEIEVFALGEVFAKVGAVKTAAGKALLAVGKYVLIFLAVLCGLQISVSILGMACDAITGIMYNKGSDSDEGDEQEYTALSTEDSLVGDRVAYCEAMDSALKSYIETWYDNDDIISAVCDAKDDKLNDEMEDWYDPVAKDNMKGALDNVGTTVNGIRTGLHLTYYNGDGEVISMKSNAKDIVSTANAWIGSDLTCKGLYKSYVESLWNYSHGVGYALRLNYGSKYIYSCDSHNEYAEDYDNIVLYYCNGTDSVSKGIYEAANTDGGSTLHNGLDTQVVYNDTDGTIDSSGKTIGKNTTVASDDTHLQTKKDNIKDQDSSYEGGSSLDGAYTYEKGEDGTEYLLYTATIQTGSSYGTGTISGSPGATYSTDGSSVTWTADYNGTTYTYNDSKGIGTRDKIYSYLTDTMGFNTAAAVGILSNAFCESYNVSTGVPFDCTQVVSYGGGLYSGLFMWYKDGYELGETAYTCARNGDLEGQLQLLNKSMNNGCSGYNYADLIAQLKNVPNTVEGAKKAAEIFEVYYENAPGTSYAPNKVEYGPYTTGLKTVNNGTIYQALKARKDTAVAYFNYFSSLSSGPTVTSSSSTTTSGSATSGSTPATAGTSNFVYPLNGYSISCNYGTYSDNSGHAGTDFTSSSDKTIYSVSDGTVLCSYNDCVKGSTAHGGFGNCIEIETQVTNSDGSVDTVRFLYAHTSQQFVVKGDTVKAGQPIGIYGATGNVTGPHLHLEVRIVKTDGSQVRVNPLKYIETGEKTTAGCPSSKAYTNYDPSNVSGSGSETGSGITGGSYSGGSTAGYYSGTTVNVEALYRSAVNPTYGTSEQGSWVWKQNENGCQRHELTYHTGSDDITAEVLSSMGDAFIELPVDNSTTLNPESSIFQLKFYSDSPCSDSKSVTYGKVTSTGEIIEATAFYCPGHLDCDEKDSEPVSFSYNEFTQHTGSDSMKLKSPTSGTDEMFYDPNTRGLNTCDHKETVKCNMTTRTTSSKIQGLPVGSLCLVEVKHTSTKSVSYSCDCKNTRVYWSREYYCTSGSSCTHHITTYDLDGNPVYTCLGHYDYAVVCQGHERCLGHITEASESLDFWYCSGYCNGHELQQYCTGHVDLDVGVFTLFNDDVNGLTELGVAKTVDVDSESYEPREENGFADGEEVTQDTYVCAADKEGDINNYVFEYSATPLVQQNLSKYVFKSVQDEFPLPAYSSELENEYVDNSGSLVSGKGITAGIKFLKCFIDGGGASWSGLGIENHWSDYNMGTDDLDKDGKVTLSDIEGAYFMAFEEEGYKDYNDDWTTTINVSNMSSICEKFSKKHYFMGFYEYVIDSSGTKANIKTLSGKYVDTEELARADENINEDWFQLYSIQFAGSANVRSVDTENQRWAYDIGYANAIATGTDYYVFLPTIYQFPSKDDVENGIPGTGFLSYYEEGMVEKTEDALGLPSATESPSGRQDATDFALTYGKKFYDDLTSVTHKTYSSENYNTLYNILKGNYDYYHEQYMDWLDSGGNEDEIPEWILNCFNNNKEKGKAAYTQVFANNDAEGLEQLKTTYIRKYLMSHAGSKFINGAKATETDFENSLKSLKSGDLIGWGGSTYLVLYQTSSLSKIIGTNTDGTPHYDDTQNGLDKGQVILLTVSNQSSEDTDCIHAFAYSLELLTVKKDSIWIYSE